MSSRPPDIPEWLPEAIVGAFIVLGAIAILWGDWS